MLLISWWVALPDQDESIKDSSELQKEIKRTAAKFGRTGVDQMDVRSTNSLYGNERVRASKGAEHFRS